MEMGVNYLLKEQLNLLSDKNIEKFHQKNYDHQ